MSTVPALQPSGSAGSAGRASWQDLESQSSCTLSPVAIYYLFNLFFLRWDMQNNTNLLCLLESAWADQVDACQWAYLIGEHLPSPTRGLSGWICSIFWTESSLKCVLTERTRSPGSYKAGSLLEQCWSCSPAAILEGVCPGANLAGWNAARRQTWTPTRITYICSKAFFAYQ